MLEKIARRALLGLVIVGVTVLPVAAAQCGVNAHTTSITPAEGYGVDERAADTDMKTDLAKEEAAAKQRLNDWASQQVCPQNCGKKVVSQITIENVKQSTKWNYTLKKYVASQSEDLTIEVYCVPAIEIPKLFGLFGFSASPVSPENVKSLHYAGTGLHVLKVTQGSAVHQAGLQEGDIIESINGKRVTNTNEAGELLLRIQPGNTAQFLIWSKGKTRPVYVKVTTALLGM